MVVAENVDHAYVDNGDRNIDYADVVPQLGMRLAAIGWLICMCCGVKKEIVCLPVGRVFVPKNTIMK